ncbi:uncharacterized protein N0V89_002418 [Didymosphaeria variabile]|uniref:RlpA-like protein double-psi beta-barrel domain-containing protein n=1 Tax=Didymosphaeria variabile TaxID=1932322 RepID=A0A9W8XUS2_9PLEO|nr:uncharacterized protein N0V89_002418 [Didymosphaeria variabile]KAJ4357842.1 hypothetical protein N0V89_002418 [Didymosphaeria variabile]
MKSAIIASALMASLALAAPVDKRAYATQTHTVVETVVVYTTVWDGQQATEAPAATSSPALFFEQPSSAAAVTSSEAAPEVSSSTPEPVVSSPTPEPVASSPTSEPAPEVPSSSAVPAAPTQDPSSGSGSGETYTGSLTMNYYGGGTGACGDAIDDTKMIAALAVAGFGDSTYDTATGNPTNKWCGQRIRVTYNGKSADATIKDRCSGCTGEGGLDATPALWEALTGGQGGASGDRLESGMSFTLIN